MAVSQNGWEVVNINEANGPKLRLWKIPETSITMRVRSGPAGFLLAHCSTWWHRRIEPLPPIADEHAWSFRKISGSDEYSNHASGTAVDLNSLKHPQGQDPTKSFSTEQIKLIRKKMEESYKGLLRWGGDYRTTPDGMHVEINANAEEIADLAKRMAPTVVGRDVREANQPVLWREW
jgi:hypothetical protein